MDTTTQILRLRRTRPVGIVVSTSRRYVVQCVCGASRSCCNDYPITKTVERFRDLHNDSCAALFDGLRASAWLDRALQRLA